MTGSFPRYRQKETTAEPATTRASSTTRRVTYPPKPTKARSKYSFDKGNRYADGPTLRPYTPTLKPYTPTLAPFTVTTTAATTTTTETTTTSSVVSWDYSSPSRLDTGLFVTGEEEEALDTGLFDIGLPEPQQAVTEKALPPSLPQSTSAKKPNRRVPIRDVLDIFQQLKLSFGKRQ